MADSDLDDSEFFAVGLPGELLDGVRLVSTGCEPEPKAKHLLTRCGLVRANELTDAGRALFTLAWVKRDLPGAQQALGQALRQLTPIQVIEQELRGLGPVPEEGVLHLLRYHSAAPDGLTTQQMRPALRWLNTVGVLVYSTKNKTIRSLAPDPDAALAGEVSAIAAMVSPRTPYRNVVRLRRILRQLRGCVWWVDPQFGARALEELAEELDPEHVSEVRILSGDAESVLTDRSLKDFRRFQSELGNRGIGAEWRVDPKSTRDWHDRWIADDRAEWNVPPVNTLFKNDYSEILPATERPPLDDWWRRSAGR